MSFPVQRGSHLLAQTNKALVALLAYKSSINANTGLWQWQELRSSYAKPGTAAEALQEATLKRAVSMPCSSTHPRSSGVQRRARRGGLDGTAFTSLPTEVSMKEKAVLRESIRHGGRSCPPPLLIALNTCRWASTTAMLRFAVLVHWPQYTSSSRVNTGLLSVEVYVAPRHLVQKYRGGMLSHSQRTSGILTWSAHLPSD